MHEKEMLRGLGREYTRGVWKVREVEVNDETAVGEERLKRYELLSVEEGL